MRHACALASLRARRAAPVRFATPTWYANGVSTHEQQATVDTLDTQALIFDFDGLILETESSIFECVGEIYRAHGAELTLEIWERVIGGTGGQFDVYDHLEQLTGAVLDRDAIRAGIRERHREIVHGLPLQEGVAEYVEEAKDLGLKLGVASSSSREWVTGHLERFGLLRYFDVVRSGTDVSRTKPDPELYASALELLNVNAHEAIALEDSPNGVRAAQAAGIFCVAVPNAITCQLPLDHANMRVSSLSEMPLSVLLRRRRLLH